MIHLYGMASPNVVKVMILLEETGLAWRFSFVNVHAGEQFGADFQALNPNSKTPVIIDDDEAEPVTIFESGAILIYLAEKSGMLLSNDRAVRSATLKWLVFQVANLGPIAGQAIHFEHVTEHFKFTDRPEEYARERFGNELRRLINVIEGQLLAQRFIAGNAYSIADIALYPWFRTLRIYYPDLVDRTAINRWSAEVSDRPAVANAIAFSKNVLAQSKAARAAASPEQIERYFGLKRFDA